MKNSQTWTMGLGPGLGAGRFGGLGLPHKPPNCFTMQYRDGIPVGDGYLVFSAVEPNWISYVWGGRGPFKAGETVLRLATLETPEDADWTRRADWTTVVHEYRRSNGELWATVTRSLLSPAFLFELHADTATWSFDFGVCPSNYFSPVLRETGYAPTGAYAGPVWGRRLKASPASVAPSGGPWPWLLFSYAESRGMPWDMPVLWVFERRPLSCRFDVENRRWRIRSSGPIGKICVMPLFGARKLTGNEPFNHISCRDTEPLLRRCERWARRLAAYPVRCAENFGFSAAPGKMHIRDEYEYLFFRGPASARELIAPVPPAVALARETGYPVKFISPDVEDLDCPTHYGPYLAARGTNVEYSIPACKYIDSVLLPVRPADEKTEPVMKDLRRCARKPFFYFGGNMPQNPIDIYEPGFHASDLSIMRMFAPGLWTLPPRERDALLARYSAGIAHYLPENMRHEIEPTSGRTFYWGDLRAAVHIGNKRLFETDHEWYSGVFTAGLWAAYYYGALPLEKIRRHWQAAKGTAEYWTIFSDWATSNLWCNLAGLFIFPDGTNYSWCGAIAMCRLARKLGERAAAERYAYLAARFQLATYVYWTAGPYMLRHRIGTVPRDYRDWMPLSQVAEFKGPRFTTENDDGLAFAGHLLSYGFPELLLFLRDYLPEKTRRYVYELFQAFGKQWPGYAETVFQRLGHMVGHFYQLDSFLMARALLFRDQLARRMPAKRRTFTVLAAAVAGARPLALVPAGGRLLEHVYDDRRRRTTLRLTGLGRRRSEIVFFWPRDPVSVRGSEKWERVGAAVRFFVLGNDVALDIRWRK